MANFKKIHRAEAIVVIAGSLLDSMHSEVIEKFEVLVIEVSAEIKWSFAKTYVITAI